MKGLKTIFKLGVVTVLAISVFAATGLTQGSAKFDFEISNACQTDSITLTDVILASSSGNLVSDNFSNTSIKPLTKVTFSAIVITTGSLTPTKLTIDGVFKDQRFTFEITPFMLGTTYTSSPNIAGGCLQAKVTQEGSTGGQTGKGSIASGQSLDQVLAGLASSGLPVKEDGSQTSPKLNNVADPMFLRSIGAFSAQVIWVTSGTGTLRSVITWDNPSVDLDLIVFGFGACFQLTPPGTLAEICDRAPDAPVSGVVFAVIIINWSTANQAFVLSLSN